jgi:hypothetical protein
MTSLYSQKLALSSPSSGDRSFSKFACGIKATEFACLPTTIIFTVMIIINIIPEVDRF